MVTREGLLAALALLLWAGTALLHSAEKAAPDGMVLVPEGKFTMGSSGKALDEDAAEKPIHEVTLPAFYIDKCEVTNAQYAAFLNAVKAVKDEAGHEYVATNEHLRLEQVNGAWRPKAGKADFPMVNVSWYGADAYAKWAGKRLATEAEWEKAARGTDGRKYPWGNEWDDKKARHGSENQAAVGSFPQGASPYGCLDMSGNAWEWTSSVFKPYPYVATDGREDPQSAERRVARGGSFSGEPEISHATYRFRPLPDFKHPFLGFRCAKGAE
ncbi:MAG: SUMF1/EgtB/PvdO family nonheme iron enzyme [Planctomycetota bacterium]